MQAIPTSTDAHVFLSDFEPAVREQGEALFTAGAVTRLKRHPSGAKYIVEFNGREFHRTNLYFVDECWESDCTCPEIVLCKHAYAAMRAVMEITPTGPGRGPASMKPNPALIKAAIAPVTLQERLERALGRKLASTEQRFVKTIGEVFARVQANGHVTGWDLQALGITCLGYSWERPTLWPALPKDEFTFWLYVAHALRARKVALPPFMEAISDTEPVRLSLEKWERIRKIAEWEERLRQQELWVGAQACSVLDVRLRIQRSTMTLELWSEQTSEFLPIKKAQMKRFHNDYNYGRLQIAGDAFPIWQLFADPVYYAREPILGLNEAHNKLALSRLVRMPSVRNRIATESGQPFQWSQERLRWDMVEPEQDDGDYRARLVLPDGSPVPAINAVLPGDPTLYLTDKAVFEGPPEIPALSSTGENLIPAQALESSSGLRLFQRLGQALPPRLERRVQRVKLPVTMTCELRRAAMLRPTEYVFLAVTSELPGKGIREVFGPGGWGDAPRPSAKRRKPENGSMVIYDRSAQQHFPALLENLGLYWDNESQLWRVRVQKGFPDAFVAWLAALPKDIEVVLDDQLATLTQNPIDAKIRLDCTEAGVDWFDLAMEVEVANCELTPEELKVLLDAKGGYVRMGQLGWKRLKVNLTDEEDAQLSKLGLGVHDISSEPQRMHVLQLTEAAESRLLPEERTEQIRRRAGELKTRVNPPVPQAIHAELRPYQVEGFHFLAYLSSNRFGGILADDMGLGKTLQTLAWLAWLRGQENSAKPILVVCPKSVMPNWGSEAARFYPGLRVTQWRGTDPAKLAEAVSETDVLVLNYAQMRELGVGLQNVSWLAAVLDEGQYIKNPESITARVARSLRADYRLTLSGTPIENRLMDLWSLMAFAMPGVLGNKNQFGKRYGRADDNHARGRLAARVRPFLLRRTKGQVAQDLPDRVEEDVICEMDGMQKTLYSAEYKRARLMLLNVKTTKELNEFRFHFLTSLLRLRQICCHPGLYSPEATKAESAKLNALFDLLGPLIEEGHKVLVFSQFVTMLEILRNQIEARAWPHFYLAGDTENRGELVEKFQSAEGAAVFLISLKAGGFGLNLTAASYVVLFDPWWNPAVENQAIDRTHRIGQTNKVIAYRLLIKDSIEEKIRSLQRQKRALADGVLGDEAFTQSLTLDDLQFLFKDEE